MNQHSTSQRVVGVETGLRALRDALETRAARVAAGALIPFYFCYHVTRFRPQSLWPPIPAHDAAIMLARATEIFHSGGYPVTDAAPFPYPPSAVLLLRALGLVGPGAFSIVWVVLMAAGLLAVFRASLAAEPDRTRGAWLAIGALSLVAADSPVSWDLRNLNSNLIYLALVMTSYALMRRRPDLAGGLLGVSVSLKLFSILIIPWLAINGPRRALLWAVVTMLIMWLALPMAFFGHGAIRLYEGWGQQLRIVAGASPMVACAACGPPLVSLRRALSASIGETAAMPVALAALRIGWILVLAWYARRALSAARPVKAPSRVALADWSVLMVAPLPLSPWLEPYHVVTILPGVILLVEMALDEQIAMRERAVAGSAFLVLALANIVGSPFAIRGFLIAAQCLALTLCFGWLRRLLPEAPAFAEH